MASDPITPLPGRVAAQLFVLGRTAEHAELVIRLIRTVLTRLDQPLGLGVDGGAESLQVLLSALGAVSGFDPVSEPEDEESYRSGRGSRRLVPRPAVRRTGAGTARRRTDPSGAGPIATRTTRPPDRPAGPGPGPRRRGGRQPGLVPRAAGGCGLLGAGAALERHLAAGGRRRGGGGPAAQPPADPAGRASSPACSACCRPCWPCPGCRPRTWSGTRPGCSSTPAGGSSGPSPWSGWSAAVLVRRRAAVVEDLLVESLLKTSDSLIIFRRRSGSIMQVAGAVDLVVYDAANPRSVIYQLDRLFRPPRRPAHQAAGPAPRATSSAWSSRPPPCCG